MLAGVRWASLNDNFGLWFGITPSGLPEEEGLVRAINGAVAVLTAVGDFDANPLPDQDPYRLTNRQFVCGPVPARARHHDGDTGAAPASAPLRGARRRRLGEAARSRHAQDRPIVFSSGTAELDDESPRLDAMPRSSGTIRTSA